MSVLQVTRAYVPKVVSNLNAFYQLTVAQIQALSTGGSVYPAINQVSVDSRLVHRKVWAWIWSQTTNIIDADLVATLNGAEVFRQKLISYAVVSVNVKWILGFYQTTNNTGSVNEQLYSIVGNSVTIGASPHRLNIAADKFFIYVNSIGSASGPYDSTVLVQSQQGI